MGGSGLRGPGEGGTRRGAGTGVRASQCSSRTSGRQPALPGHVPVFAHQHPSPRTGTCRLLPTKMPPSHGGCSHPVSCPRGPVMQTGDPAATRNRVRTFTDAAPRPQLHWSGQSSQPWSDSDTPLSFCLSATLQTAKAGPDHPTHRPSPLHSSQPGHRASLLKVGVGSLLSLPWRTRVHPSGWPAGLLVVYLLHLVIGFLRGHTES